jgi:hypothetical protein
VWRFPEAAISAPFARLWGHWRLLANESGAVPKILPLAAQRMT